MRDQLEDIPVQDAGEAVAAAREWSNGKVFQIGVHAMRGNLTIAEAGTALSNVAESSVAFVLEAVVEDFLDRGGPPTDGGVAVALFGSLATGETMPGTELDVQFIHSGGPLKHHRSLSRRFDKMLRALTHENLLLAPGGRERKARFLSFPEFEEQYQGLGSSRELLQRVRARCVFVYGGAEIAGQFEESLARAQRARFNRGELRAAPVRSQADASEPGLLGADGVRGGRRDVERAVLALQSKLCDNGSTAGAADAIAVIESAASRGLIAEEAARDLGAAAAFWRDLEGSLALIAGDGFALEDAKPGVKASIARACGLDDCDAFASAVRDYASKAAVAIDAL